MTENKRFELTINKRGQADIIDKVESKEKNAICIYNDLGVLPYSSAKAVCDLLNEQEELIKRLKQIREEQIETILKQKRKIKELTTQLQTEEDDVCIKCKHHYLTKKDPLHDAISNGETVPFSSPLINIKPYYISKCKKEHDECSKEDIRYCKDFELTGDTE